MNWYEIVGIVLLSIFVGIFLFLKIVDIILGKKPTYLGVHNGQLAPMKQTPKGVCSYTDYVPQQMNAFPFLGTAQNAVKIMLEVITNLHNYPRIKIYDYNENYLWAYDTSLFWHWKDDIEFYFNEKTHLVQFRSSPRYGYTDGGFNRRRMQQIQEKFLNKNKQATQ